METFADRLKAAMNEQGLKQVDLVRLAQQKGIKLGKSHVSQYVSGKTIPRTDILHFVVMFMACYFVQFVLLRLKNDFHTRVTAPSRWSVIRVCSADYQHAVDHAHHGTRLSSGDAVFLCFAVIALRRSHP